jgi:hypothetical protein
MWCQRSHVQWLSEGDKNTHFFHQRASRCRKKNRISRLKRSDGTVTEDVDELMAMSQNFYDTLYMSEGTSGMDDILDSVAGSVTPEMNSKLITPFDSMEIKVALF